MLRSFQTTIRILSGMPCWWNVIQAWLSIQIYISPASNRAPVEPESPPFWTDPACSDAPPYAVISPEDHVIAGLIAQQPGTLWSYITGHLRVIKTTTTRATLMTSRTSKSQHFGVTSWSLFSSTMVLHRSPSVTRKSQQMAGPSAQIVSARLQNCAKLRVLIARASGQDPGWKHFMCCFHELCVPRIADNPKHNSWRLVFALARARI